MFTWTKIVAVEDKAMSQVRINQIVCNGKIHFASNNLQWVKKKIDFYSNNISITRYGFNIHLTRNIRYIFQNNLRNLLKSEIEQQIQEKILSLTVKITNIQHSITLNYNKKTLISSFLTNLDSDFKIDLIQITQEAGVPATQTTLEQLLAVEKISYLCITVKLLKATLKLQLSKDKEHTHSTLILNNYTEDSKSLIDFLKKS